MLKRILAIFAGLIAGSILIAGLLVASHLLHPPPAELDLDDRGAVAAWVETLPVIALLLVVISHAAGTLLGAVVATLISGRTSALPAVVVGCVFLVAGLGNLIVIPHPLWLAVLDLLSYIPCALAGYLLVRRPPPAATDASGDPPLGLVS